MSARSTAQWCLPLALGALAACHRLPHPATLTGVVAAPAPTRLLWVPRGQTQYLHREADGTSDVVAGTLRVRVHDDEIAYARQQFAHPMSFGARVAHGWVYLAEDGAALASSDFLGPLVRVGDFPDFYQHYNSDGAQSPQHGRVAVVDRHHVAWMSDGGPFVRITALGPLAVEQAYFVDENHGAAITDGGVLRCTADGGARWRVMPLHGRGATHMLVNGPLIRVLAGPWHVLLPGCEVLAEESGDSSAPVLPPDAVGRYRDVFREALALADEQHLDARRDARFDLRSLLAAHDPAWIDLLGGVARPDGTRVVQVRDQIAVLDGDSGRGLAQISAGPGGDWCNLGRAGRLIVRACEHGGSQGSSTTEVSYLDLGTGRTAEEPPATVMRAQLSDLTDFAVAPSACEPSSDATEEPATAAPPALCVLDGSAPAGRTRRLAAAYDELVGVFGRRALLRLSDAALGVVDLAAAGDAPLPVTTVWTSPAGTSMTVGMRPGGAVTALLWSEHQLRGVAVGRPGDPLVRVAVPDGAERAVFADPAHGYAWSRSFFVLQRTRDGGRSWEPLPSLIDGAALPTPERSEFSESEWSPPSMRCSLAHCLLDEHLIVAGWGSPVDPSPVVFAARAVESSPEAPPPTAWFAPGQLPRLRCTASALLPPLPPLRPLTAPAGRPSRRFEGRTTEGALRSLVWSDASGRLMAQFAWNGRDAEGPYAAAGRPGPLRGASFDLSGDALDGLRVNALGVGRSAASVLVWTPSGSRGELHRVAADGVAAHVHSSYLSGDASSLLRSRADGFTLVDPRDSANVLDLPPGGVGLAWRRVETSHHPSRDDDPAAHLWAVATRGPLGVGGRGAARLLGGPHPEVAVYPVAPSPDAEPTRVGWHRDGLLAVCRAPAAPDAWTLAVRTAEPVLGPRADGDLIDVIVETSASGACLRGVERRSAAGSWVTTAAEDGALRGVATEGLVARSLECRP